MADKINDSVLNKLKSMFGVGYKNSTSNAVATSSEVFPTKKTIDDKGNKRVEKIPFDDKTSALFDYWLSNCHDDRESWKSREALFQDMDLLYFNCPIIAKAVEYTVDEVLQADNGNDIIMVEGKRKIKKFIQEFFDKVNINDLLKPVVTDIVLYGNAGIIPAIGEKGIDELIPVDVYSIKDRLEFTPFEVEKEIKQNSTFKRYSKYDRIQDLIDSITDKDNISSYFKKYLLGFQIEDAILPPWKFIHFRNPTTKSPFAPFGLPMYIHSMAPYRQYDIAMGLQQTARASSFPRAVYKLNIPNIADPVTKVSKAVEFLSEIENSGLGSSKKQIPGIGEIIVTINDMYDFSMESAEIDLGKFDDIQALKDDIINSAFLPRNLLDPNDSSFGDSGVSLIEKWKPFARVCYHVQRILLQGISQIIKIHAITSQEFEDESEIDFILSMKYPEGQTNNDIISSQTSLMDLANSIIQNLQDRVTGGAELPPEMVKEIYCKFLPYDQAVVAKWIDAAVKSKEENVEQEAEDEGDSFGSEEFSSEEDEEEDSFTDAGSEEEALQDTDNLMGELSDVLESKNMKIKNRWRYLEKTIGKQKLKEKVEDIIFETKQESLRECNYNKRHYYSSRIANSEFDTKFLVDNAVNRVKRLNEKYKIENKIGEAKIRNYSFQKEKEKKIAKGKKKLF